MSSLILRTSLRIKILLIAGVTLLIVLMFPAEIALNTEVSIGAVWIQDDLIAEGDFPVLKDAAVYRRELEQARKSIYPVFTRDDKVPAETRDTLRRFFGTLLPALDSILLTGAETRLNTTFFSDAAFNYLLRVRENENKRRRRNVSTVDIVNQAVQLSAEIYKRGILNLEKKDVESDSIAIRVGNVDLIERKDRMPDAANLSPLLSQWLVDSEKDSLYKETVKQLTRHFIRPNIIYQPVLTREEIEIAQSKVSRYTGIVTTNERIVAKHDRITPEIKLKIDSYSAYKGEVSGLGGKVLQFTGKVLHIFALIFLFGIYLYKFRYDVYLSNKKLLIFAIIFIWLAFVTYLVNIISVTNAMQLLIFIPAGAMLLTIMFDSRVGFYSTVIISLICGGLRGNDYTFAMMNIAAGAMAAYSVRDIKNRTQIFKSFLSILLGYTVTIIAFGLERYSSWDYILLEFAFAGTSALISPVLTYGLLVFFEKLFKLTTDLTLVEMMSFDRPLLRELSSTAPGTFNHSLNVSNLAEEAATAIGANALLTKVGAYYHDIGKTYTPEYFVENQRGDINYHDKIKPEDSVQLILNHVKKGLQMAEENGLPEEVIQFIPAHHGTGVLTFFYEKAKAVYGDDKVNINDYRYPGPKPATKETAIVMLADTCESAARSLANPDPESIEKMVEKLIRAKKEDGQLDESPLTFRDITKITEIFSKRIPSLYHRRVPYPEPPQIQPEEKDEEDGIGA